MSRIGTVAIFKATFGWHKSRRASPIRHRRGIIVDLLANYRLRHRKAASSACPGFFTAPVHNGTRAASSIGNGHDTNAGKRFANRFALKRRDPACAPQAKATARNTVADIPHLAGPMAVRCAATLCRMTGVIVDGLALDLANGPINLLRALFFGSDGLVLDSANVSMLALQTRLMGRIIHDEPFSSGPMTFAMDATGRAAFTMWLVRR